MLVFYPMDFSPVCSDQLSIYQEVKPEIAAKGVELVGVSVDSAYAHKAFQEKLGVDTTLLSDFEPKGEVARAYGSYIDGPGIANRTLVLIDEDGTVAWTYESPTRASSPAPTSSSTRSRPSTALDPAAATRCMSELTSAPSLPGPDDHVRGEGEGMIVYADLACPHCAAAWEQISARAGALAFRHFPVASKHPRSPALHAAAEAAGGQGSSSRWSTRSTPTAAGSTTLISGSGPSGSGSTLSASRPIGARRRCGAGATRLRVGDPRRRHRYAGAFRRPRSRERLALGGVGLIVATVAPLPLPAASLAETVTLMTIFLPFAYARRAALRVFLASLSRSVTRLQRDLGFDPIEAEDRAPAGNLQLAAGDRTGRLVGADVDQHRLFDQEVLPQWVGQFGPRRRPVEVEVGARQRLGVSMLASGARLMVGKSE